MFCFRTLKNAVERYEKTTEGTFWFKQMMCYHVYVPLLLQLFNDVEENPGPTIRETVASSNTVCAEFSKGNRVKFGDNGGKQCVAMSLTKYNF